MDIAVRHRLGDTINAAIKSDIVVSCGEDTYNMLMDAVAAQRRD